MTKSFILFLCFFIDLYKIYELIKHNSKSEKNSLCHHFLENNISKHTNLLDQCFPYFI